MFFVFFFLFMGWKYPMNGCRRLSSAYLSVCFCVMCLPRGFSPAHCFFPFCLPSGGKGAGMTLPPAPSCGGYAWFSEWPATPLSAGVPCASALWAACLSFLNCSLRVLSQDGHGICQDAQGRCAWCYMRQQSQLGILYCLVVRWTK